MYPRCARMPCPSDFRRLALDHVLDRVLLLLGRGLRAEPSGLVVGAAARAAGQPRRHHAIAPFCQVQHTTHGFDPAPTCKVAY
jgi:hypothetical protein